MSSGPIILLKISLELSTNLPNIWRGVVERALMNNSPSNIFYKLLLADRYLQICQAFLAATGMNGLKNEVREYSTVLHYRQSETKDFQFWFTGINQPWHDWKALVGRRIKATYQYRSWQKTVLCLQETGAGRCCVLCRNTWLPGALSLSLLHYVFSSQENCWDFWIWTAFLWIELKRAMHTINKLLIEV